MQNEDFKWFVHNYLKLFQEYGHSYLAIKNKTVIGVYTSYGEGVRQTMLSESLGTFIVQECNGSESAYTNYISSVNFS